VRLPELFERDLTLALVADIDDRVVLTNGDDGAAEEFTLLDVVLAEALREQRGKVFLALAFLAHHIQAGLLDVTRLVLTAKAVPRQVGTWYPSRPEMSTLTMRSAAPEILSLGGGARLDGAR